MAAGAVGVKERGEIGSLIVEPAPYCGANKLQKSRGGENLLQTRGLTREGVNCTARAW